MPKLKTHETRDHRISGSFRNKEINSFISYFKICTHMTLMQIRIEWKEIL